MRVVAVAVGSVVRLFLLGWFAVLPLAAGCSPQEVVEGPVLDGSAEAVPAPVVAQRQDEVVAAVGESVLAPMGAIYLPPLREAGDLDGFVTTDRYETLAEREMVAGRLGKVHASYLFRQDFTVSGAHQFRVMTICPTDGDTAVVVYDPSTRRTWFNDNADALDQYYVGGNGYGSYVDTGSHAATTTYTVYVVSMKRGTALCQLRTSTANGGYNWQNYDGGNWPLKTLYPASAGYYREFGGSLVRVGPLQPGDFVEVQTDPRRTGYKHDTHMVLVQLPNASGNVAGGYVNGAPDALYANNQSSTDLDPRIPLSGGVGAGWLSDRNYVLVGKYANWTPQAPPFRISQEDVETVVDLIRGPLGQRFQAPYTDYPALTCTATDCTGQWRVLPQGRYYAWIYVKAALPTGQLVPNATYATGNGNHWMRERAGIWFESGHDMPFGYYEENGGCYGEHSAYAPYGWRGTPNQNAFTLHLDYQTGASSYTTMASRVIPLGALGTSDSSNGYNLFLMELRIDSPNAATYPFRLRTSGHNLGVGLSFFNQWQYERNPDSSELKVVTWNFMYYHPQYDEAKMRNAADLFATRGTVRVHEPGDNTSYPMQLPTWKVEARPDQVPFQWEADIVGLQEVPKPSDHKVDYFSFAKAEIFRSEANYRSALGWSMVRGTGEEWSYPCLSLGTCYGGGLNPLYVNSFASPVSGPFFSAAAKGAKHTVLGSQRVNCSDMGGFSESAACHLVGDRGFDFPNMRIDTDHCTGDWAGYSDCYDLVNFATPAKAAARRYSGTPTVTSPDRPVAVFNWHLDHEYADTDDRYMEAASLVGIIKSMLQAEPGAFNSGVPTDLPSNTSPLHYQNRIVIIGDSNTNPHACGEHYVFLRLLREHFGYAIDASLAVEGSMEGRFGMHDTGTYDLYGVPDGFQSWKSWQTAPDYSTSSRFPWWARTFRGKTSQRVGTTQDGDRHDIVFLVGKGWAYDDPVLSYKVMSDATAASPLNPSGRGVEMWAGTPGASGGGVDDGSEGSVTDNSPLSYAPNHPLYSTNGTQRGKPALHTDHRPVGARLRVFRR